MQNLFQKISRRETYEMEQNVKTWDKTERCSLVQT
jgi:hypothetical protein